MAAKPIHEVFDGRVRAILEIIPSAGAWRVGPIEGHQPRIIRQAEKE